jgi:hypothetical protein
MFRKIFVVLFFCAASLSIACQVTETVNSNRANSSNAQANMPPGISSNPVITINNASSGNSDPNAPKATIPPKGATPTPGIPDPAAKTPQPKNTPKIPGIPTEAELKKQMNTPVTDRSIMERKPPAMESNSNMSPIDRPRKVRRP